MRFKYNVGDKVQITRSGLTFITECAFGWAGSEMGCYVNDGKEYTIKKTEWDELRQLPGYMMWEIPWRWDERCLSIVEEDIDRPEKDLSMFFRAVEK